MEENERASTNRSVNNLYEAIFVRHGLTHKVHRMKEIIGKI